MKKLVAMLLAALMLFAVVGCTPATPAPAATEAPATQAPEAEATEAPAPEKPAEGPELSADGRYPAETIKIGFVNYDTSAEQVLAIQKYFAYLQTAFNFEMIWSESLASAEAELDFIEQCAAAGCQAVIGYYNEARAESIKLASDLGMYYWGQADLSDVYASAVDIEKYIGGFYSGDAQYQYGRSIAQTLIDQGCKKLIVMSGGKDYGVAFFIDRYQGMMDVIAEAQAAGTEVEVVYEVPGWPGTEEFAAHQTAALETDADGLAGSLTALMWLQPMQVAGKMGQIKIACVDTVSQDLVGLMEGGIYVGVCAEISGIFGMAIPMIINAVDGHGDMQRMADGKPAQVNSNNWVITSAEDMAYFASIEAEGGTQVFDIDDIKSVLGAYNPDFTVDDLSALYSAVTADEIKARR